MLELVRVSANVPAHCLELQAGGVRSVGSVMIRIVGTIVLLALVLFAGSCVAVVACLE